MFSDPFVANHQSNLLLAELSGSGQGTKFHHIIGWGDLSSKRVPITVSIEPQSEFGRVGGWGMRTVDGCIIGFLLYDRDTERYFNPDTGEQYTESYLAQALKQSHHELQNRAQ